jgi:hypothetical protein
MPFKLHSVWCGALFPSNLLKFLIQELAEFFVIYKLRMLGVYLGVFDLLDSSCIGIDKNDLTCFSAPTSCFDTTFFSLEPVSVNK